MFPDYKTISRLSDTHQVFLVEHIPSGRLCVKKVLSIYDRMVYERLRDHPVDGIPRIEALEHEGDRLVTWYCAECGYENTLSEEDIR